MSKDFEHYGKYGKSVRLGKPDKMTTEERKRRERLSEFVKKKHKNRDKAMDDLRNLRLKLNDMSLKDIGYEKKK